MVVQLSAICVISGGLLACAALRRPQHRPVFERLGGGLIVVGLALLGAGLALHW